MKRQTVRVCLGVVAALSLATVVGAEDLPKITRDWPSYLGQNNSFSETSGVKLVDDMTLAKLVWESQEKRIGFGKAHSAYWKSAGGASTFGDLPPGGGASPIVAGGLVIMSYFVPSGDAYYKLAEQLLKADFPAHKQKFLVSADDVVIAIDAATGKTRWKFVGKDKGRNWGGGKRPRDGVTPVAVDGRVYAVGSNGRMYAFELASGKLIWESAPDEGLETSKQEAIATGGTSKEGAPFGWLLVHGGVVLVPAGDSLRGVDPLTGKIMWTTSGVRSTWNMPAPVTISGEPFFACVNAGGTINLLEPKTGKSVWKYELKCQHLTPPIFGKELLVVFDSNPKYNEPQYGGTNINSVGTLSGYRLTKTGAQRVWCLADTGPEHIMSLRCDGGPSRKIAARDGILYVKMPLLERKTTDGAIVQDDWGSMKSKMLVIDEKDGKVLGAHETSGWSPYLWGNRLITITDVQHRPRGANPEIWQMYDPDPATFKALGKPWHVNGNPPIHMATGGYEMLVLEAFSDGFMFCRVAGGIRCYDLRAPAK